MKDLDVILLYLLQENQRLRKELQQFRQQKIRLKHLQVQQFNAAEENIYG